MKIQELSIKALSFKGTREDRNIVEQLKQNNDYSLTENNQKRISKSIENLAQNKGEKNLEFLLDVAENLQYGTNIKTDSAPRNDWKAKLKNAVETSFNISDPIAKNKYESKIQKVFDPKKPLSPDEKALLDMRSEILKKIDKSQLQNLANYNVKNIEKNLNNFIISSETPLQQKKYILNRLDYFLSPEYKINPQLEDKKTLILAEMLNDLVVASSDSKIPNTKSINQKQHGMCAAISIARKLLSYEYKTDFVDSIMSELDDSPYVMVYDLANLGSGKKVPVNKIDIDFDDALNKGYRIIDASTTQWMNIADMYGVDNENAMVYTAFDKKHFGTFADSHNKIPFKDDKLNAKLSYYQALLKAKSAFDKVKISQIKKDIKFKEHNQKELSNLNLINELNQSLDSKLKRLLPNQDFDNIHDLRRNLLSLEVDRSSNIDKLNENVKKYHFLPNEESKVKKQKIKSYLQDFNKELSGKNIDSEVESLLELIEMSNSMTDSFKSKQTIRGKINQDKMLFNAAAAYRTSVLYGLKDSDLKTDLMIAYEIPDFENFVLDAFDQYISKVNSGNKLYLEDARKKFKLEDKTNEEVVTFLYALKAGVTGLLTTSLDNLYEDLGAQSRKAVLLDYINKIEKDINKGDKEHINILSTSMHTKPKDKNKILSNLREYKKILSNEPTEKDYRVIYNNLGLKNQLELIAEAYEIVSDAIQNPDDEMSMQIIANFKSKKGIPENISPEVLGEYMNDFVAKFNNIASQVDALVLLLTVKDAQGNKIFSADPDDMIIKKMENEGSLIPAKDLAMLAKRYDAIAKFNSDNEYNEKKVKDLTLYKYTPQEKEALKKIQKSINKLSSDVNKELNSVYREIKEPLEEHTRKIGLQEGHYWASSEGHSGLSSPQSQKIIQQMTDKPYQVLENYDKAIDIIKNTPHSGTSSTSVFHNQMGAHAQYIAEISEHNGKDILYHDNSWGVSEHENIWIDSEGLLRTDYLQDSGGELGYLTDSKWRNGNYVDNLLKKAGEYRPTPIASKQINKLRHEANGYKFPMIFDIMVQGMPVEADEIAGSIRDNIFISGNKNIDDIEKLASNMTVAEIKNNDLKIKSAIGSYRNELRELNKRLNNTVFDKSIKTKEDFDKLADDDKLKVTFEKAALLMSYNSSEIWKKAAKAENVKDVNKLRTEQKNRAREDFNYAFAKSPEILYSYALNRNKNHLYQIIKNAGKNNGLEISDENFVKMIKNTATYTKEELKFFDGSLDHTMDYFINNILKNFDTIYPKNEQTEKVGKEIKENLRKELEEYLYYKKSDLSKNTKLNNRIKNYIDRKYNPQTDEEFVEIYRKLQNMTTEDFEKETKDATPKDMAFDDYSAFEVLERYKAENEIAKNTVSNAIFHKYYVKEIDLSKTQPAYRYKKLQKKNNGAYYVGARTFDDLYRTYKNSLQTLNYKKEFDKYKDKVYRNYGVMPSYPRLNVFNEDYVDEKLSMIQAQIDNSLNTISANKMGLQVYELTDKVANMLSGRSDNEKLTDKERRVLNNYIGEFITNNYGDSTIEKSLSAASEMLEIPQNDATFGMYKQLFADWQKEIGSIRRIRPESSVIQEVKDYLYILKESLDAVIKMDIPVKYQHVIKEDINNLVKEELKDLTTYSDSKNVEQAKKLISQISKYSQAGVNDKTIQDFYQEINLLTGDIKKLKNAFSDNQTSQSLEHKDLVENMLPVMKEFIPENLSQNFSDDIIETLTVKKLLKQSDVESLLYEKISDYSNVEKAKIFGNEQLKKLALSMTKYNNLIVASENYRENLEANSNKLGKIASGFIDKNIKPEYASLVSVSLKEYIETKLKAVHKTSASPNKIDLLTQKIKNDFIKYNYMNNTNELLDRYLELCAKDGPIAQAKNQREKLKLENEKEVKKGYLKSALSLASLVEMQEILMDAKGIGNPALITKKLKNYDSDLEDSLTGAILPLSDPKVIDYMVRALMLDKDFDTAISFIETLGLTDRFLEIEDENIDVKDYKKGTDKVCNILKTTDKQTKIINEVVQKYYQNIDNTADYAGVIDKIKQEIIDKTKRIPKQKNIKSFLSKLDDTKAVAASSPDISKSLLLSQTLDEAFSEMRARTNYDIQKNQVDLQRFNTIYNMICELKIPEYRDAYKYKKSIDEKYNEIVNYNDEKMRKTISEAYSLNIRREKS